MGEPVFEYEPLTSECWQCGGEGIVYDCFEEFACLDPEGGCELCGHRCDICGGDGVIPMEDDAP